MRGRCSAGGKGREGRGRARACARPSRRVVRGGGACVGGGGIKGGGGPSGPVGGFGRLAGGPQRLRGGCSNGGGGRGHRRKVSAAGSGGTRTRPFRAGQGRGLAGSTEDSPGRSPALPGGGARPVVPGRGGTPVGARTQVNESDPSRTGAPLDPRAEGPPGRMSVYAGRRRGWPGTECGRAVRGGSLSGQRRPRTPALPQRGRRAVIGHA